MARRFDNVVAALLDDVDHSSRVALREGRRGVEYAELADQVRRAATVFRKLGTAVGERVAIYAPDSIDAAVAILGAMYAGAVAVPVTELGSATDVRDILRNSAASIVVVHDSLRSTLDSVRSEVSSLRHVLVIGTPGPGESDFRRDVDAAEPGLVEPVGPDAVAVILYSAGARANRSDAQAVAPVMRGVPHAHGTPLLAFDSFGRGFLQLTENDRVLSVVRMSTAYGLGTGLLFPLAAGAETILLPEQPSSQRIFDLVEAAEPTVLLATPSIYGQLARDAVMQSLETPLARLRAGISGAEDMPPRVITMARQALGTEVSVGYGLTEAFQFVIAGSAASGRPGACGTAMAGFELRIVDDVGAVVGPDEIGTLQIRGETVAAGYWGEEQDRSDDWFTTRDRFMVDADGHYYHCGRVDHLFKVGGKWVSPGEVERALLANEAVWECAVVGADDEDGLIKPLAFVVANIGHTPGPELEEELRQYVKDELAPYKYPRWIEFVDELPKGPTGGILRYKLREQLRGSRRRRRAETASTT